MLGRSVDEELLDGEEDLSFSPLTKAGEGVNLKQQSSARLATGSTTTAGSAEEMMYNDNSHSNVLPPLPPLLASQQSSGSNSRTSGRWTKAEHSKFVEGIRKFGRNWKRVEEHIGTRTGAQIRSHAQKFFHRLEKEKTLEYDTQSPPADDTTVAATTAAAIPTVLISEQQQLHCGPPPTLERNSSSCKLKKKSSQQGDSGCCKSKKTNGNVAKPSTLSEQPVKATAAEEINTILQLSTVRGFDDDSLLKSVDQIYQTGGIAGNTELKCSPQIYRPMNIADSHDEESDSDNEIIAPGLSVWQGGFQQPAEEQQQGTYDSLQCNKQNKEQKKQMYFQNDRLKSFYENALKSSLYTQQSLFQLSSINQQAFEKATQPLLESSICFSPALQPQFRETTALTSNNQADLLAFNDDNDSNKSSSKQE